MTVQLPLFGVCAYSHILHFSIVPGPGRMGPGNEASYVVCFSLFIVCAGVLVTGEGVEAVGFVQRHPEVLLNVLVFGVASAVGQVRGCGLQWVR